MAKPTLYALMASSGRLDASSGDRINELRTLRTLSAHFDVFYNNEHYSEGSSNVGDADHIGPTRQYDYYYIRNNPEIFGSIKGRRLSFAFPYSEAVFDRSDALVVLNENWKRHLLLKGHKSAEKLKAVYEGRVPEVRIPVINVGQTMDEALVNQTPSLNDVFKMRAETTGARGVFGFYGNLSAHLYPRMAFSALEKLYGSAPTPVDPLIVLAGRFRKSSEVSYRNSVHLGTVPYEKMAALHSVTLANLTNESPLNHCLGNQKVIDSISLGIPMMCQRLDTFVEQLGPDYPGLYETEQEAYRIARRFMEDDEFLCSVRALSKARAVKFRPEEVRMRFLAQPELEALS